MRGDRAVTGAAGPALGPIRRRARRVGVSLVEVGPAPVLAFDRRRPRRGASWARARFASACSGGTRPRTSRLPTRSSTRSARPASRTSLPTRGAPATPRRAGPDGWSCSTCPGPDRGAPTRRSSSTGRTTRPALARSPPRSTSCGPSSGAPGGRPSRGARRPWPRGPARASAAPVTLVIGTMADKDVDGLVAALGTSRSLAGARVIATAVPGARAMPPGALAARWKAGVPGIGCRGRRRPGCRARPGGHDRRGPRRRRRVALPRRARPEHASWTTPSSAIRPSRPRRRITARCHAARTRTTRSPRPRGQQAGSAPCPASAASSRPTGRAAAARRPPPSRPRPIPPVACPAGRRRSRSVPGRSPGAAGPS